MTYKEFESWCNYRACDGCWSMKEAIICIGIIEDINNTPFWKRKKKWKELENEVVTTIVEPINELIKEYNQCQTMNK